MTTATIIEVSQAPIVCLGALAAVASDVAFAAAYMYMYIICTHAFIQQECMLSIAYIYATLEVES